MSTGKTDTSAHPGDTFIAYIDDTTAMVGVVISEEGEDVKNLKTLVLGYFKDRTIYQGRINVFVPPFHPTFPHYLLVKKSDVMKYDFEPEIALCMARDSNWWKSAGGPCYTNLVAKHFRPRQLQELQLIHTARFILGGGVIDDFVSFNLWNEDQFLKLWVVLYRHFPEKVKLPPRERDSRSSNCFYAINLESDPPTVACGTRPCSYTKDPEKLSIY